MNNVESLEEKKLNKKIKDSKAVLEIIDKIDAYIIDEHKDTILLSKELLTKNITSTYSYKVEGPKIILYIKSKDLEIAFEVDKTTKSYKANVDNIKEDSCDKYAYKRYTDCCEAMKISRFYEDSEEIETSEKIVYDAVDGERKDITDTYRYKMTELYFWVLQESSTKNGDMVILQIFDDSYNVNTSLRGMKCGDVVEFYEGTCGSLQISQENFIAFSDAQDLIDIRTNDLVEGTHTNIPIHKCEIENEYIDYYNSEYANSESKEMLEHYAENFFRFSKNDKLSNDKETNDEVSNDEVSSDEETKKIKNYVEYTVYNAKELKSYMNFFNEMEAVITMKDGTVHKAVYKKAPVFYINPENCKRYLKNPNLESSEFDSIYIMPYDISLRDVFTTVEEKKMYLFDKDGKVVSETPGMFQQSQVDLIEDDEIYLFQESTIKINTNNAYKLPAVMQTDYNGVYDKSITRIKYKKYRNDEKQDVYVYENSTITKNASGYNNIIKSWTNASGEENLECCFAIGKKYYDSVEDKFYFDEIYEMCARKIIDGRDITLDTIGIKDDEDEDSEPMVYEPEEVPLYSVIELKDVKAGYCLADANDEEFQNVFNILNQINGYLNGEKILENARTITFIEEETKGTEKDEEIVEDEDDLDR